MPITFYANHNDWNYYNEPPDDVFMDWKEWSSSLTPWEVANAVEDMFEEDNLVKSVVHFRGLVKKENDSLRVFLKLIFNRLVILFQRHKQLDLQCETALALLCMQRIWSTSFFDFWSHTRVFVDSLSFTNPTLRECGARIICSFPSRQLVKAGAIKALYRLACSAQNAQELETAVWALSEVLPWHQTRNFGFIAPDLATLVMFLHSSNPNVVKSAVHTLERLAYLPCVDAVLQAGVLPQTAALLTQASTNDRLISDLLEVVRNIAGGSESHIQLVLDHDLLRLLHSALKSDFHPKSVSSCEAIANICSGSQHQIQQVIAMGIFRDLVEILRSCPSDRDNLRVAAVATVVNATHHASSEQMQYFVDLGCVQELCRPVFSPMMHFMKRQLLCAVHKFLKFGAHPQLCQSTIDRLSRERSVKSHDRPVAKFPRFSIYFSYD